MRGRGGHEANVREIDFAQSYPNAASGLHVT